MAGPRCNVVAIVVAPKRPKACAIIRSQLSQVAVTEVVTVFEANGAFERRDQMLLEQIAETVGPVLEHIPIDN